MPIISNFIDAQKVNAQILQKKIQKKYEQLSPRERFIVYIVGVFVLLVVTAVVVVVVRWP
jgi:type II secretory pathway component PulM